MKTNTRSDRIASLERQPMATGSEPFGYRREAVPARLAVPAADRRAASLSGVVRSFASCQEAWIERVRFAADRRWYERLYSGPDHDVWVIAWMPGQSTGFHDHGLSSGAYCVVHGALEDHRPGQPSRFLSAGEVEAFGSNLVHDVRNASSAPAISLHAYSPALTEMQHYELDGVDLRPLGGGQARPGLAAIDAPAAPADRRETASDHASLSRIDRVLSATRARLHRLTPEEAYRAVRSSAAIVVDIRPTRQRDEEGAIPGALIVDRNVLEWRLDPTSPHRLEGAIGLDALIVLVCSEGYASSLAAASLQALGLWRATDIVGGFKAWQAAGLPTVAFDPVPAGELRPAARLREGREHDARGELVSPEWLESRLGDPDIRIVESSGDTAAYGSGHIPGAVHVGWGVERAGHDADTHIPSTVFDGLMSSLGAAPDTTVVLYGDDDNRWARYALSVFQLFAHANVKLLAGGRARWAREKRPLTTAIPAFVPSLYTSADQDAPTRVFHGDVLIALAGRAERIAAAAAPDQA